MHLVKERFRLLAGICLLLSLGFVTTNLASYLVSRDTVRDRFGEQTLVLAGDNIYSEIQKDILRPIFISSLMAQDTFLRDWMLSGEVDQTQISRYLAEIKHRYGTVSSFLVSERSRRYYYGGGLLKEISESEPRDKWYFRVRDMQPEHEINIDPDMANRDTLTVFINHKVHDYAGQFIGATGVGLTLDKIVTLIEHYQQRFDCRIYFVDRQGQLRLMGPTVEAGLLHQRAGMSALLPSILAVGNEPHTLEMELDDQATLISARHIPELDWFLVVEHAEGDEVRPLRQMFWINLLVSTLVTLLILGLLLLTVNRFQRRLAWQASRDSLTGCLNRQAFERLFEEAVLRAGRRQHRLSALLLDVDHFKRINDRHGHLVGDAVLKRLTQTLGLQVREGDNLARWGGEEFILLLETCSAAEACMLAERLRAAVANDDTAPAITLSLGVAVYQPGETLTHFFARLDGALYLAKRRGRNRCELADAQAPGE